MSCPRANIDLTACEGATFDEPFVWLTGEDPAVEVDLTNYEGVCHIREKITSEEIVFTLVNGVGVIIADQETDPGKYSLYISAEDMEETCPLHKTRNLVYDLRLTAPDGVVRLQQYGTFTIEPAVTRPWIL